MRIKMKILLTVLLLCYLPSFCYFITKDEAVSVANKWLLLENNNAANNYNVDTYKIKCASDLNFDNSNIGYLIELFPKGFILMPCASELSPIKYICFSSEYKDICDSPFFKIIEYEMFVNTQCFGFNAVPPINVPFYSSFNVYQSHQIELNSNLWYFFLNSSVDSFNVSNSFTDNIEPLIPTRWSQGTPYNKFTPVLNGTQCPTGCAITSYAQIFYYWKYPRYGRGSHTYTWTYPNEFPSTASADFNHEYYWDKMCLDYDNYPVNYTTDQADAVARLMSDLGIACEASYSPNGTGASTSSNYYKPLAIYFKYSTDMETVKFPEGYSDNDVIFGVVKNELIQGRPLEAGILIRDPWFYHSVVIDGCRSLNGINQVHVNIGWGGAGYYTVDNIIGAATVYVERKIHPATPPNVQLKVDKKRINSWTNYKYYSVINVTFPLNADEINYPKFNIMRKMGNGGYEVFKSVELKELSTSMTYNCIDKYLSGNTLYTYRIDIIDADGALAISSEEITI